MSASTGPAGTPRDNRIAALRRFNRFYTSRIGVVDDAILGTEHNLAEARLLFELASAGAWTATGLGQSLGLDAGHVSRTLTRLERRGLVTRRRSRTDGRQRVLALTAAGKRSFATLDRRSRAEVSRLLDELPEAGQRRLLSALASVEELLARGRERPAYVLRDPVPGDLGWVIERHGAVYAAEYGWDERFETLVARIAADYAQRHDARRERAWIAEIAGRNAGCVFLVRRSERVAQLRLLLVEPAERGSGLGTRLVEECVRFARRARYRKLMLWTMHVLGAAARIYERAGFALVSEEAHAGFGTGRLRAQTWETTL